MRILACLFQKKRKKETSANFNSPKPACFQKKKRHLSHRARRNFISKANTVQNKKKKKRKKILQNPKRRDHERFNDRGLQGKQKNWGGKKKKKKRRKKGEAIERESIERWILTSRNCLNVCSVKIDVRPDVDAVILLGSPLLLNQRLTYGRLVSPLNYIRIRFAIRD